MGNKATNLAHFQKRAIERIGMRIEESGVREIVRQIQNEEATLIKKRSKRRGIWLVSLAGKFFYVAYSNKHQVPITVYPLQWKQF